MSRLRLAVIGAGHMGRLHALKVAELAASGGDVELAGIADLEPDRARALAGEAGAGIQVARDVRGLVDCADAVVVAVPTVAHFEVVECALSAGLDVLVEKPIAATLPEAEKLIGLARERGRVLLVGHLEWFNAAMREVAGAISRPRFVEAHRLGPFPARGTDVDVVRDLMIHDLDIIQRLVGESPEGIDAIGVPVLTERVDIANARLHFPGGCVANCTASRVSPTPLRKIRFFQPDGYFSIDFLDQQVVIARRDPSVREPQPGISVTRLEIDREDALLAQLRAFRDAVRTRRIQAGAGSQGLEALRTALRIVEAMPPLDTAP